MPLRVIDIVEGTTVDGPGLRTSVYFAGCRHACPGCHNPQSWDFSAGHEMTVEEIMQVIRENDFDVTFSGGDPLYQPLDELARLAEAVHACGHDVWCYTGFIYEDLIEDPRYQDILLNIDILVDGPFVESLRDTRLHFRGSSNQRIIPLVSGRRVHRPE
ncbi:MAG: anaerobic ribonucleoside-triphosphate reductase activating protein [Bacteroidales bacterium]|nr:anaerobic ribonucleoside-triphosphate reductase activating protein [Bacteroidales bacterium]